jgi:hypothetical protein
VAALLRWLRYRPRASGVERPVLTRSLWVRLWEKPILAAIDWAAIDWAALDPILSNRPSADLNSADWNSEDLNSEDLNSGLKLEHYLSRKTLSVGSGAAVHLPSSTLYSIRRMAMRMECSSPAESSSSEFSSAGAARPSYQFLPVRLLPLVQWRAFRSQRESMPQSQSRGWRHSQRCCAEQCSR